MCSSDLLASLTSSMEAVPRVDRVNGMPTNDVFTEEKRRELYDEYRRSRTVRVEKKTGRNDPCPCGSGKKYKNCCGKKA